ncbi:MAG: mechanosensitive ion channel [Rhodocyclaceae bacterium]|nr:mechanosensitive ion channel [Rhodocyclaceae bacterium]
MFDQLLAHLNTLLPENWLHAIALPWTARILGALVIWLVGKWLVRHLLSVVSRLMLHKHLDSMLIQFLSRTMYVVLLIALTIAVLDYVGIPTTSVLAVFGAAGLAVGLALRDSLANFAAGIMLIIIRPFKIGHYVEVAGTAGFLEQIHIFSTTLRTPDNRRVIIPNNQIAQGIIIDYDAKPTRRIDLTLGIGYQDDPAQAIALIERLLAEDTRILKEPAACVAVSELAESSVNLIIRPWVKSADYWDVRWHLTQRIHAACAEAGISIPFPQRELTIHHTGALPAPEATPTPETARV